ncbi:hypothetical protein OF83DRAFT_1171335 [Amylostereum chailletii]|nr:hypothetical protein OF83DRAFT_1171335 [Amylostereum chailletii]
MKYGHRAFWTVNIVPPKTPTPLTLAMTAPMLHVPDLNVSTTNPPPAPTTIDPRLLEISGGDWNRGNTFSNIHCDHQHSPHSDARPDSDSDSDSDSPDGRDNQITDEEVSQDGGAVSDAVSFDDENPTWWTNEETCTTCRRLAVGCWNQGQVRSCINCLKNNYPCSHKTKVTARMTKARYQGLRKSGEGPKQPRLRAQVRDLSAPTTPSASTRPPTPTDVGVGPMSTVDCRVRGSTCKTALPTLSDPADQTKGSCGPTGRSVSNGTKETSHDSLDDDAIEATEYMANFMEQKMVAVSDALSDMLRRNLAVLSAELEAEVKLSFEITDTMRAMRKEAIRAQTRLAEVRTRYGQLSARLEQLNLSTESGPVLDATSFPPLVVTHGEVASDTIHGDDEDDCNIPQVDENDKVAWEDELDESEVEDCMVEASDREVEDNADSIEDMDSTSET